MGSKSNKKNKKNVAPKGRVITDSVGITFKNDDFNVYVLKKTPLLERVIYAMRVDLTDNQICSVLNISKEALHNAIRDEYGSTGHLRFLISILPNEKDKAQEMILFWLLLKEKIEQELKICKTVKEIAEKTEFTEEQMYRYISNEFGKTAIEKLEGIKEVQAVKEKEENKVIETKENEENSLIEEKTNLRYSKISMEDYAILLGFKGLHFDFEDIDKNIIKNVPNMTFEEFVRKYSYESIESMVYVRTQLLGVYKESRPFFPSEDAIIEKMYANIGTRVTEVMKSVISNYIVRDSREYRDRLKSLKTIKIHPENSWGISKADSNLIEIICKKGYPLNNKFIPWMSTADIQYYAKALGFTDKEPKKMIEKLDLENMDLTPYIDVASKLKEVKYHDVKWTTTKHEYLKEQYKEKGILVAKEIDGVTKEDCVLRVKQFLMKQRYTEEDAIKIKEIFEKEGFEGVLKAFSDRTETALKFKCEELGLMDTGIVRVVKPTDEQIIEIKEQLKEEVRKEESERIRKELIAELKIELRREVERELTPRIEERVRKNVEYTMRKELIPQLREKEGNRIKKEVTKLVDTTFESNIKAAILTAVSKTAPKDFGTKLAGEIYEAVATNIKVEFENIEFNKE